MANQVTISNTDNNVTVTQETTQIVTVAAVGPQGPVGPRGPVGPEVNTGSFATTGSNVFIGDQIITGSVLISGSSTFTNIGPAIFSGSINITEGITGSLAGTGSYALEALSASYAISASHEIIKEVSSSYADTASIGLNNFETISYNNSTFNITGIRSNGGQQNAAITNVPSASYSDTASLADNATNAGTATNASNVYVDAASTTTINVIPTYQADGGTDGYKSLQLSSNPLSYYYRTTNRQSGVSQQADELYIGGGANTAGGIFLNSTVGIPSYVSADGPLHLFSQGYKVQISSSANDVEIIGNITASGNISASGDIITNALTASGLNYPSADGVDGQFIVTDGAGNLSFGHGEKLYLQVRNDDSVDITAGTPIYSTGEIGGSERIKVRIAQASDASKMPAIGIVETTLTTTGGTKDGFAIINGIYNTNITPVSGTPVVGNNIYVHADGGVTLNKPSGSNLIQNIGTVLKTNGTVIQGMKVSSIDRTNDVPNLLDNTIFFGSGSDQTQQIHISGALDQTVINNITASGNISASGTIFSEHLFSSDDAVITDDLTVGGNISGSGVTTLGTTFIRNTLYVDGNGNIEGTGGGESTPSTINLGGPIIGANVNIKDSNGGGNLNVESNITASGNISASGDIFSVTGSFSHIVGNSPITVGDPITFQQPITASFISSSGQIIGEVVDNSFETFLNFESATSYTYIAPFPLTVNFTGSSTSSMEVVGFVTASANTDTFSTQQTPPITLNRFDKLKITPSSSGLFTFSGSRII